MKEVSRTINYKGQELKLVFNLNVMEVIQEAYGSLEEWAKKTDGNEKEPDIKALIYGMTAMFNEGIDIENDELPADQKKEYLTHKQVGRIITEVGIGSSTETVDGLVIDSVKDKEADSKNE